MQVTITNLTNGPLQISDLYATIAVGVPAVIERSYGELTAMSSLITAIDAGTVSVALASSAAEAASGLVAPGAVTLPYTPAVTGDWTGADPTTVEDAIDRIAAALGPIA